MSEKQNIFSELAPEETIIELNRCKVSGYMPTDWHRRSLAVKAATEAVRKHIPQRAVKSDKLVQMPVRECPVCKALVTNGDSYCRKCGQALCWD